MQPAASSAEPEQSAAGTTGDTGDMGKTQVAIPISPQKPISPVGGKRTFGVQKQVQSIKRTRVIQSGKAWEWWWWERNLETGKNERRTRYGGMRRTLSEERQRTYERNRKIYWERKIAAAARREADELRRGL